MSFCTRILTRHWDKLIAVGNVQAYFSFECLFCGQHLPVINVFICHTTLSSSVTKAPIPTGHKTQSTQQAFVISGKGNTHSWSDHPRDKSLRSSQVLIGSSSDWQWWGVKPATCVLGPSYLCCYEETTHKNGFCSQNRVWKWHKFNRYIYIYIYTNRKADSATGNGEGRVLKSLHIRCYISIYKR